MTPQLSSREIALRNAVIDLLWIAVVDRAECSCCPGGRRCTHVGPHCRALRSLGIRGHFDWRRAERQLLKARQAHRG